MNYLVVVEDQPSLGDSSEAGQSSGDQSLPHGPDRTPDERGSFPDADGFPDGEVVILHDESSS